MDHTISRLDADRQQREALALEDKLAADNLVAALEFGLCGPDDRRLGKLIGDYIANAVYGKHRG